MAEHPATNLGASELVLERIGSLLEGYEAWGDDDDVSTTIVRSRDEAHLVRVHHGPSDDPMVIERLDAAATLEDACALVLLFFWREHFLGDETAHLVDRATGIAFRFDIQDVAVRAAAPSRERKLATALSFDAGSPVVVTLSPLRSAAGRHRYDLTVRVAGQRADGIRAWIDQAVQRLRDEDEAFERVELDAVNIEGE